MTWFWLIFDPLLNCGVEEDSWESLGLQGDPTSPFWRRSTLGFQLQHHISEAEAEAETPVLWPPHAKSWLIGKDSDAGRDWGQEEKGTTDGWMASLTRWTWVWVNSRSWWWTGRLGVLRFMGLPRVGHDWVTELNWISVYLLGSKCRRNKCVSSEESPFLGHYRLIPFPEVCQ